MLISAPDIAIPKINQSIISNSLYKEGFGYLYIGKSVNHMSLNGSIGII